MIRQELKHRLFHEVRPAVLLGLFHEFGMAIVNPTSLPRRGIGSARRTLIGICHAIHRLL
jgi:hypothetical protein